jgi:hypothetical protein
MLQRLLGLKSCNMRRSGKILTAFALLAAVNNFGVTKMSSAALSPFVPLLSQVFFFAPFLPPQRLIAFFLFLPLPDDLFLPLAPFLPALFASFFCLRSKSLAARAVHSWS